VLLSFSKSLSVFLSFFATIGTISNLQDYYVFVKAEHWDRSVHEPLDTADEIKWMEEQVPRQRYKRSVAPDPGFIPHDPYFNNQWHLHNDQR